MDRRRNRRITALLPVRVWGVDNNALPFTQLARVKNISSSGAVIQGMLRQVRPDEIVHVQSGELKAQFRVIWANVGTDRKGEIGIESLPDEPSIWEVNLVRCSEFVGKG